MYTFAAILATVVWLACPTLARAQQEEPSCDDAYSFVAGGEAAFRVARVKGAPRQRAYFFGDEGACPNGRNCQKRSYLVPGDEVIATSSAGSFACVWFQPKKGTATVGWMLSANLEFVEFNRNPKVTDWLGDWSYRDNSIRIAKGQEAGQFAVTGSAIWYGAGDNFHIGDLDSSGTPQGHVLKLDADDDEGCKVRLWLVGTLLIAADNLRCGGVNVTFAGVYSKSRS